MTCGEARQYIFAFLDNELDSALSLDVQQHIEHCPHCARECEIENVVRRELATKLQQDDVPAFDEALLLNLLRPNQPTRRPAHRGVRRYVIIGLTGATAAALLFALTLFQAEWRKPAGHSPLADALVDDFTHFVTEAKPLQIVSTDSDEVSRWLQEQTALAVRIPALDSTIGTLQGGRKCKIAGKPAAFAIFRIGDELASVVAMQESDDALASMRQVDRDGHTHWVDRCRGHTVLACRRGALIYAIVSRLPEELLSSLMPPVNG